ncbi:MAG TPA: transposase, partial [Pirellulales bacterium]|nr:transposase [Pirellulales bacterium]
EQLEHRLDQVLRKLYGRSSEKVDPHQLTLFEASPQASAVEPPAAAKEDSSSPPRNGHGRRPGETNAQKAALRRTRRTCSQRSSRRRQSLAGSQGQD